MNVNRSVLSRAAIVLCGATFVGFLSMGAGCSSKDEILGDATAQAVEAGLNEVLAGTVDPLFSFFGFVADLASGGPARSTFGDGFVCPDMESVCSGGGSGQCTGGLNLTFSFSGCGVVTGDGPLTLSGGLIVTPVFGARGLGSAPVNLTLQGLSINGSSAMAGTGVVDEPGCTYDVNVTSDDALVDGTIVQCVDEFPTTPPSNLRILIDDISLDFIFNGTVNASAAATQDGSLIANCSVNLDSLTSSCSAP